MVDSNKLAESTSSVKRSSCAFCTTTRLFRYYLAAAFGLSGSYFACAYNCSPIRRSLASGLFLRSGKVIREAAAPRKRSRVHVSEEELRFFQGDTESWEDDGFAGEEGPSLIDNEITKEAQQKGSLLNRDRRVMRMGDDERAYYDRLNAYRDDRKSKSLHRFAARESTPTNSSPGKTAKDGVGVGDRSLGDTASYSQRAQPWDGASPRRRRIRQYASWKEENYETYSIGWYEAQMRRQNDQSSFSLALKNWDSIRQRRLRPTPQSYAEALRACHHLGDLRMLFRLLKEMREEGITDLYSAGINWAVRALTRSRRYRQTLALLEKLAGQGLRLRTSSFRVLMEELAAIPRWREVLKVRKLMQAYKVSTDADTYGWTIAALVALGQISMATKELTMMGDSGLRPSRRFLDMWGRLAVKAEGQSAESVGEEKLEEEAEETGIARVYEYGRLAE